MSMHIGRHWSSTYQARQRGVVDARPTIEEECPCPVEPCGLVDMDKIDPECPEHSMEAAKTIRANHRGEDCPGASA
ncbi:MAG: hypothetical protein Q8Q29_02035 [Actinomycetota bacterium]|nr:hypothetical protein [Actinomycetota bacterium]